MGVYIPNMKMPENCAPCPFSTLGMDCVLKKQSVHLEWLERRRPDYCPLVELPPHGDFHIKDGEIIEQQSS